MEPRVKRLILTVGVIAVLGGIITAWINIYPDILWFKMLNYLSVYTEILFTKILVGIIVGLTYLVILLINLFIVYKYTPAQLSPAFLGGTDFTGGETNTRKMIFGGLTIMAVLFSILMGYSATDRWEIYLRYTHAGQLDFQAATPITVNDGINSDTISVSTLELDRISTAQQFANEQGVTLVFKGAPTVTGTPDGNVWINSTGNPGMATGGMGDVLTGVIAGLMAQGISSEQAGALGVYVHGLAGDIAVEKSGMHGLIASDVLEAVPEALSSLIQ
jgi:hypothetical protein